MKTMITLPYIALLAAVLALPNGCSKDDDQPVHRELTGRVAEINEATGEVTMLYYHPGLQREIKLPGRLAPNAEILINGRTASLKDVLIDDKVTVRGRQIGRGEDRDLIADHVHIERPEALDIGTDEEP